jgi:hypothetical protein
MILILLLDTFIIDINNINKLLISIFYKISHINNFNIVYLKWLADNNQDK